MIRHKKPRKNTVKKAVLCIKAFDLPLVSRSTGQVCESICLEPYKPYTVGRKYKFCDFVIIDSRISKRHCQLLFDSLNNSIYLSDGVIVEFSEYSDSFCSNRARGSLNGVSVNGIRISGFVKLQVGDEVRLVCGKEDGSCWYGDGIGFMVEKIVFMEEVDHRISTELNSCHINSGHANFRLEHYRAIDKTRVLLSWCKDILGSEDPISYIRKCIVLDQNNRIGCFFVHGSKKCFGLLPNNSFYTQLQIGHGDRKRVYSRETGAVVKSCNLSRDEIIDVSEVKSRLKFGNVFDSANANTTRKLDYGGIHLEDGISKSDGSASLSIGKLDVTQCKEVLEDNDCGSCIIPPGKKFYLNRLRFEGQDQEEVDDVVSLPELFHPIKNLVRVFIATFTSDISW